ncbi:MAG: response regulator transcription factor [Anaerolineae bacterium]|nr:response regulator transcription factor [Anaerolineae bacterium]
MPRPTVLVVEDEPNLRKLIRVNLERRDYLVREAEDGLAAQVIMQQHWPDAVILDLRMPRMDGVELTKWIRQQSHLPPILVLSAINEEAVKVEALDEGADDYIVKPFRNYEEFFARLRAVMRRAALPEQLNKAEVVEFGGITVDIKAKRVFKDGQDLRLTRTEFNLLAALAHSLDKVLSHDDLLAKVWGGEYVGSNHYLHVYLGRLRKKLEPYDSLLETVAGIGYTLKSTGGCSTSTP